MPYIKKEKEQQGTGSLIFIYGVQQLPIRSFNFLKEHLQHIAKLFRITKEKKKIFNVKQLLKRSIF